MTASWSPAPTSRRSDLPVAEGELDEHLTRLVRRTSVVRQGFYFVVLLVALAGQVSGAVEALGIPLAAAIPAVSALELGGVVVLANADVRRRLGERAIASRLLSVAIAASAVVFNWLAHANHLLGGFFAGMSALGYMVWLMHTENQRRDRLRVKGDLPPTTPAYEMAGHWIRHPWLTLRARALAKANPQLGLYESLAVARAEIRRERRQATIAKVLHRKIRSAVDPRTADIAIAVYDLDEIASRLADRADYDGLTTLIAADLAPERLAPNDMLQRRGAKPLAGKPPNGSPAPALNGAAKTHALGTGSVAPERPERLGRRAPAAPQTATLSPAVRQDIERRLNGVPWPAPRPAESDADVLTRRVSEVDIPAPRFSEVDKPTLVPNDWNGQHTGGGEMSLRRRVHAALDATVLPGDQRDDAELIGLVYDELQLNDVERLSAGSYVRSWRVDAENGQRIRAV